MISIIYQGNNNTIDLINSPNLTITGYKGLEQPLSETITSTNPYLRGSRYQRSQIADRNISFTFAIYDVENTRQQLMNVFKSGEKGILTLKNDFREGQIECYLEELAFGRFETTTTCTIFLRCPDPYFKGLEDILTELDNIIEMFVLEAYIPEEGIVLGEISTEGKETIVNNSDIDVGVTIEMIALDQVVNPIFYNETKNQFFGVNYTFSEGDKLIITTGTGNKKVYVDKNGVQLNIINKMMRNSSFFQLKRGNNLLSYEATSGGESMVVTIKHRTEYGAI